MLVRHATRASSHAFAHAYAACPGEPSSEATEEKATHQSSFRVAVTSCSRKAPGRLGRPHTFQAFPAECGHEAVIENGRRVHHSAQRQSGLFGSPHELFGHSG